MDVAATTDPVAAVLAAHERGTPIALRTSATTSAARTVVRTTGSWVTSFPHVSRLCRIDESSRVWVPGPLSATMNLFAAVHARATGATLVDSPADATHAALTPAALSRRLGDLPAGLRVLVAGDRLSPAAHRRATAAGVRVAHYYGAAELSFVAWGTHAEDLSPFPGVEVVSRDGVLWVRSPYLCQGYAGPPGPLARDAHGFATVGDRGLVEDGRVVVHGRGTEAVTTAGATVLVADVEQALRDGLRSDVVVVGLPHHDLGQVLVAVLTGDPEHVGADLAAARRAAADLPAQARPRRWFHRADLPVGEVGKVDRAALVGLLVSGDEGVRRLR